MKLFLRRKSSKVNGEEKDNKNNAKINSLAVIEDNEAQSRNSNEGPTQETDGGIMPSRNRRPSIAETVDSTSTTDSKKKEGYRARLAAQSQQPQLQPWMAAMTPMSHSAMSAPKPKPKPKPRLKPAGSIVSAGQSTESVPASIGSTVPINVTSVEAPNAPPSPSYPPPDVPSSMSSPRSRSPVGGSSMGVSPIALGPSSGFSSSSTRSSLMVPPSPSVYVTPPALPPKPPPAGPLPQLPVSMPGLPYQPVMVAPLGPLANPFRSETPVSYREHPEPTSPVRPPPPPPPPPAAPPKLQRNPSRGMPPPSAFSKHKRSISGRTSPNPSLPSLPVPPPPPPPPPPSGTQASTGLSNVSSFPPQSDRDSVVSPASSGSHFRNESLSNFPEPPSATGSQRSASWDNFVPDLTGYYGGPAPFVAELETIPIFPEPPSGNPSFERQELDVTSPSNDEELQAAEDKREAIKVLLPEGMTLHPVLATPSDTSTNRNDSVFSNPSDTQPKMTDGVFLSNAEHTTLLSDLADLRARLADLDRLHTNSLDRISEWEAYKANIDIYVEKTAQDRQGLIDKLQNSAQAHSTVIAEKERQFNELATTANNMKQTIHDWQTYSQRLEADKTEAISRMKGEIEREKTDNLANIQAMEVAHNDEVNRYKSANAIEMERLRADHAAEKERLRADNLSERNRLTLANDSARTEYEQQKSELMGQLSALDAQNKELMPQMVDLDTKRRKLQGELVEANADREEFRQQIQTLNAAKASTLKELTATKIKLANLTSECDKVKRLLEEAQPKIDQLAETRSAMERMKETEISMEKFLQTANDEKDALKEKLKQSMVAKARLGTQLSKVESQVKEKDTKIAALEKSNEALKTRMYLLGQRMAEKVEWWQGQVGSQAQTAA
ncbi:hypothetical protein TWF679_000068 [Orbilia oligospora]|uniref:Uncharacterized protein n=1 Tax=Orbilia oligospora TaxID=2813651 RepID=A0A8H8VMY8_ORBOL|nr:hypothetical protein TWF679_000068 [Orbilia oligospora]